MRVSDCARLNLAAADRIRCAAQSAVSRLELSAQLAARMLTCLLPNLLVAALCPSSLPSLRVQAAPCSTSWRPIRASR